MLLVIDIPTIRSSILSAEADVVPPEREGGGGDLLSLICAELGVAPLVDPGMDLEDELPSPASSPVAIGNGWLPYPRRWRKILNLPRCWQILVPCRR